MNCYLAHIICDDGEQAVVEVPAGATESEIAQEAAEQGHKYAGPSWTQDEEIIERGRYL
jgi:hypothetical protein